MTYNKIIIGAGIYGLYSALFCAKQGETVLVLEKEDTAFKRATLINQARVHMGYHYPRSISTAVKSKNYFDRFCSDYGFCINSCFEQIYATAGDFSWTNAEQFKKFCADADIRCDEVLPEKYFKKGMCDGAFLTTEYTYDAVMLRDFFIEELKKFKNAEIRYHADVKNIFQNEKYYEVELIGGERYKTEFLINTTYASVNQIHDMLSLEPFKMKYELCEIILCDVSVKLKNIGITVMDGPFFSIMPFGKTNCHSLTSVTFTPHKTSYTALPEFQCQEMSQGTCTAGNLGNCNSCPAQINSAWEYMSRLAKKYLQEEYSFKYKKSLFSMKPILIASEIDDSRPTLIKKYSENPTFISVFSGKINTVYDLDEVLRI